MPTISTFFGIERGGSVACLHRGVIRMFYSDEEAPHFFVEYQGQRGKFDLSGQMIAGDIQSGAARRLIRDWTGLHRSQVQANWRNMKAGKPVEVISSEQPT